MVLRRPKSCIIIKSDGLAQRGCDAVEDGQHDRNGFSGSLSNEPRRKRHTGFALMEYEHGPRALADDEVARVRTHKVTAQRREATLERLAVTQRRRISSGPRKD